jgi:hypothetical protein
MLTVTQAALERLSQKLERKRVKKLTAGMAMRFTQGHSGWRLRPDAERPMDEKFTYLGRSVLLLDSAASEALTNRTLDVREADAGPRLTLR